METVRGFTKKQRGILQLPIILLLLYLVFSLILYEFGPIDWKTPDPMKFWLFQAACLLALLFGYQLGLHTKEPKNHQINTEQIIKIFKILLIANFFYIFLNLFRTFGFASFDFPGLGKALWEGLQNPGAGYTNVLAANDLEGYQVVGGYLGTIYNLLWYFVAFPILVFGAILFTRLKWNWRLLIGITYGLIVLQYFAMGTNIGIFRIILIITLMVVLYSLRKSFSDASGLTQKQKTAIILLVALAALGVLLFFVKTMKGRGGILYWESETYNIGGVGLDRDSVFFKILPEGLYITLISVTRYLTCGYYGLALCMEVPWVPMFGFGSSMNVVDMLTSNHIFDLQSMTYQYRAMQAFGWDDRIMWHSMYSWFANDFSFFGVILIMFGIGFLFAMVYKDCLFTDNPFAKVLFVYFVLMFFFIPCNNQIIQSFYTLFSFVLMLVCWFVSRWTKAFGGVKL